MFVNAIETAKEFTRAIHFVVRNYESDAPYASAASLFMVNSDGWAVTCKHVAANLIGVRDVNAKYDAYKAEYDAAKGKTKDKALRKQLAEKYGYSEKAAVQGLATFVNCVADATIQFDIQAHPDLDLALLKFKGFSNLAVSQFPKFARQGADLKQGRHLCRLGFPFAEFTNYEFDKTVDSLSWTAGGRDSTPLFPLDGMVTRHLVSPTGTVVGFEMSTPGLKGQSGGPVFDAAGVVWGMQFATNHLDLDFDIIDREVLRDGVKRKVNDRAFLHVGNCIHVDALKTFMAANGVKFEET